MTKPWERIDTAIVAGGSTMTLDRRDRDFVIRIDRYELMGSRMHGSEEILAEEACARIANRPNVRVLVGGLGMGFTLAAALRSVGEDAEVVVAELVPQVVAWNREHLGHLAGHPLDDPRTTVFQGDVADAIREAPAAFDAILLDVDNGPMSWSVDSNHWLYGPVALRTIAKTLRPGGVLGVWGLESDNRFKQRMEDHGYGVVQRWVRARRDKGPRHWIWLAEPGVKAPRRPRERAVHDRRGPAPVREPKARGRQRPRRDGGRAGG